MYKTFKKVQTINGDFMKKQIINCSVYDCLFCNRKQDICELKEIKVAHSNSKSEKEATMCASFESRD